MWAEWCEACKKMDRTTFSNKELIREFKDKNWTFLKLDVTESNEINDELLKKYKIVGLPTLVLFSKNQSKQKNIQGYVSSSKLINIMRNL